MLSRVADNLYWMSRYLERAEHTARLIDVSLYHLLDQNSSYATERWQRLCESLRIPPLGEEIDDAYSIIKALVFSSTNTSSVLSCLAQARDNARQVREQISSEMWVQLNRLFLHIKSSSMEDIWFSETHEFLNSVKEGIQLFQGMTDATMNHSEGWHFIRVGRFIERTWATSALLDVHFRTSSLLQEHQEQLEHLDYLEWVGLLRSCSAFEAYCKVYTANIQPRRIAEFLLFNAESPRSIRFAAAMMQGALHEIARTTSARHTMRVERLAGRFRAMVDYDQIEDVFDTLHSYLDQIQRSCTQIHNALYQTYIFYPVDVAFVAEGAAQS